jgi:flagellin-like hook-associated protein FlgL
MRGAYYQFVKEKGCPVSRLSDTTEAARAKAAEDAELRLARIANAADPAYKNGKKLLAEYQVGGDC